MRLVLVRHGVTEWNAAGRLQGQLDVPLSPAGLRQAAAVALSIPRHAVGAAAVYSSDLSRAAHTAEAVAETLGVRVYLDCRWREIHGGELQGLDRDEILSRYPGYSAQFRADPYATRCPGDGGESYGDVEARVVAACLELAERHDGGCAVVVSHGGALRRLVGALLELPRNRSYGLQLDNASISVLELSGDGNRLLLWNDCCHLGDGGHATAAGGDVLGVQ